MRVFMLLRVKPLVTAHSRQAVPLNGKPRMACAMSPLGLAARSGRASLTPSVAAKPRI